jgi:cytoskeletal protein RodZ
MNHTIKGIIIVVAITSMLVVGASMIPVIQNSFAERDTNTNTNTNSADSSSTSDATADNTNNINNTATSAQSQEQDACAVAVTCPEGSTTVTSTPPTPPTAKCHPSTVGGITATPTDDTCTASLPAGAPEEQGLSFLNDCVRIPGHSLSGNRETGITCTFPSTPPA